MKTKPLTSNFFGHLNSYDGNGQIELYIDKDHDLDGRLLRQSLVVSTDALAEYVKHFTDIRPSEIDALIGCLINENKPMPEAYAEVIGEYLLMLRHHWVPLDDDNQPIPIAVESPMFNYYNQ